MLQEQFRELEYTQSVLMLTKNTSWKYLDLEKFYWVFMTWAAVLDLTREVPPASACVSKILQK